MNTSINNSVPSSTTPVKVMRASQMVGLSIMGEVSDLKSLGLIGEDSFMGWSAFTEGNVTHWSKKDYQQWQAYKNEGSPAALKAAEYQVEMRQERIEAVNGYLSQVYDLSAQYSKLEGVDLSFAKYLNYKQGESDIPKASGAELEKIAAFWQENSSEIDALTQTFNQLEVLPKDLESWLQTRDFAVADEVHEVVDKLKNAWTTTRSDQTLAPEYSPVLTSFDNGNIDGLEVSFEQGSKVIPQVQNGATFYSAFDSIGLQSGQNLYQSWGSTHDLIDEAAKEYLKSQQRETYQEMQVLSNGLYNEVSQRFGTVVGFADFSMQDIVDNFIAGKPLGTLDNGLAHPQAKQIEDFWQKNQRSLILYSYKQEQLDNPLEMSRYKEVYITEIKRHLQQNLDYFLNKPLPIEYNV